MPGPGNLVFRVESGADSTHRRAPRDASQTRSAEVTWSGTAPLEVVGFENRPRQPNCDILQYLTTAYELHPMTQLKSKSKVGNKKHENQRHIQLCKSIAFQQYINKLDRTRRESSAILAPTLASLLIEL